MKRRLGVRDGMRGFFSRFMLFVFRFQSIHEALEIVLLLGLGEGVIVEYRLSMGGVGMGCRLVAASPLEDDIFRYDG